MANFFDKLYDCRYINRCSVAIHSAPIVQPATYLCRPKNQLLPAPR